MSATMAEAMTAAESVLLELENCVSISCNVYRFVFFR